jgi:ribosome-binding protein aMBF1 (putative translation factor)
LTKQIANADIYNALLRQKEVCVTSFLEQVKQARTGLGVSRRKFAEEIKINYARQMGKRAHCDEQAGAKQLL